MGGDRSAYRGALRLRVAVRRSPRNDELPSAQCELIPAAPVLHGQRLRGARAELIPFARGRGACRVCVVSVPDAANVGRRLAAVALAGGIIGAVFLALSALSYRVLAERLVAGDPALAHGLLVLSYLAGGPAIGVPLALTAGAFAAAIRRDRTLPVWLWWLSTVAAVLGVATVTTLLGPTNNSSAAYGVLLLGAVALFAWLVASSVVLLGRTLRAEDRAIDPARAPEEKPASGCGREGSAPGRGPDPRHSRRREHFVCGRKRRARRGKEKRSCPRASAPASSPDQPPARGFPFVRSPTRSRSPNRPSSRRRGGCRF